MTEQKVRCVRCGGARKMYKIGGGYSQTNCGGVLVKCPLCNGEGTTKPLHLSVIEMESKDDSKKEKPKRKSRAKAKGKAKAKAEAEAQE